MPDAEKHRSEMTEEYYKLFGFVQAYDSYFVSIKAWSVTATAAVIAVGFKDLLAEVFAVALLLAMAFWYTEVRFKLLQFAHMGRLKLLETTLGEGHVVQTPGILHSYVEARAKDEKNKRWQQTMWMPHVMFPHVIFIALSFLAIIYTVLHKVNALVR